MKISSDDFNALAKMVKPLDTPERRQAYRDGNYPRANATKDLNKRYRWDLLFAARAADFVTGLYSYLTDVHIDTALKKIVPTL